ncbi:uncharacterized protein [Leuresthes tenuis]|uniref:uncharacterized protein n=1 Tax=Leuresthes tenuis TaxID=355514 RepID=UPI003B50FE1A
MRNQTGPPQEPVPPQVRYHPSIQAPVGGVSARSTQTQKTGHPPQTGTGPRKVQQNQDATDPSVRPEPEPAAEGPDGLHEPVNRAPPSPEQDLGAHLDRCAVEQVEVLTRGQRQNPDWFAWRKNRITASMAHCIARSRFVNGQRTAPPTSYLAAVTGERPRVQTRAMSWGVQMEAEAVRRYQELKSAALGRRVTVQDCGLFIDARRPWLGASPDGIVTDSRTGQWLLCLEVKCPYKHRHGRVEDACRQDPAFCLQLQGEEPGKPPVYRLKASHSYFTQIQCQLAVTGLKRADLVVFTLQETAVVPVTFDPELWEDVVSKLEVFYRDAVLPHIRKKTQLEGAASWTPEL